MKILIVIAAASAVCAFAGSPVDATAALETRSSFVNYGLVMGRDPIVVPSGRVAWEGWYVSGFSLVDYADGNGRRSRYKSRTRKVNTSVGYHYDLPLYHFGVLSADLSYMYEYVPRCRGVVHDTQFVNARIGLEGRWLEPAIHIERDLVLDDGTYVALEVGHTFQPFDRFTVRPLIAQGFGDGKRSAGCFGSFDSAGLMDVSLRLDLGYAVTDWLKFCAFVAYHDFWFGDGMREAAADFNGRFGHDARTWNFSAGIGVSATF